MVRGHRHQRLHVGPSAKTRLVHQAGIDHAGTALADISGGLYDYFASTIRQGHSPRFALIDILKILQDLLQHAIAAGGEDIPEDHK